MTNPRKLEWAKPTLVIISKEGTRGATNVAGGLTSTSEICSIPGLDKVPAATEGAPSAYQGGQPPAGAS